jgi:hypothetical protein
MWSCPDLDKFSFFPIFLQVGDVDHRWCRAGAALWRRRKRTGWESQQQAREKQAQGTSKGPGDGQELALGFMKIGAKKSGKTGAMALQCLQFIEPQILKVFSTPPFDLQTSFSDDLYSVYLSGLCLRSRAASEAEAKTQM